MTDAELRLLAVERQTEHTIDDICSRIISTAEYVNDYSHVTSNNVVEMQQVIALLESAEYYALQANLMLLTIKKK